MTSPGTQTAQRYVILGATGGIGSETARRLYRDGHATFLAGRDRERLTALSEELRSPHAVFDATDADSVEECLTKANEELGGIDGAVNCVGSLMLKPAHRTAPEEWRETVAINLDSAFFLLRAATPHMRKEGGSIVLVSSAAARLGMSNHEAIAAAKAGVIGLTLAAAASYASQNIRVNCVAPGLVDTPLAAGITGNATALNASTNMHALGRIGAPAQIASALCWLLDPEQDWVTGQVLGVDGGLGSVMSRKRG